MAKRKNGRFRPTLAVYELLQKTNVKQAEQIDKLNQYIADLRRADATDGGFGKAMAERRLEAIGHLHNILDELGPDYASVSTNMARRFLKRPEGKLHTTAQRVFERIDRDKAAESIDKAAESLFLAS